MLNFSLNFSTLWKEYLVNDTPRELNNFAVVEEHFKTSPFTTKFDIEKGFEINDLTKIGI